MSAPVRILHLDDNPLDAQLVALTLEIEREKFPTTLRYVQTKEQYLAALSQKDFDIILSDYRMPGYDGDSALASAQEICPEIPFIMVTGELGEEFAVDRLQRGVTDYVLKDRIYRLIPAIKRALAEREIRRRQQKAEEEARKAHREANEVLESVQDPFYGVDREWRLTYVNSKAEAVLGKARSELLGRVLWEAFPQAIGTKSHEMLLKAMAERTRQHFETHSVVTQSWIEVHAFPKADGGLSVLYRDITGRKAQEEALRLSEERFALAFRASPDPFVISRLKDGTILDVNESFLDLFAYMREEVIGQSSLSLNMFVHNEDRERAMALLRREGKLRHFETQIRNRQGEEHVVLLSAELLDLSGESALLTIMHDVSEERQAQVALRESEERVRRKLDSILSPAGDLGTLELADLVDAPALKKLLEEFHAVAHLPIGVIDVKGNVLVGIGWQNICTDFHRVNPETCKYCIESDTELSAGIPKGEFRLYKCKNNLWDIATPIIVGGHHLGNLFSGQFFFEEETIDREFFRAQARQYGFNEEEYLASLETVPRLSRDTVQHGMEFLQNLADTISQLGYSNVKLARTLAERDRLTKKLHDEQETFKIAQEIAHLGSWELDVASETLTWSDEVYRIFGLAPQEFAATYEAFLEHVHPEDQKAVDEAYSSSLRENRDGFAVEHRVVRKGTGELRIVHESCRHIRDSSGAIVRSVGMALDITERKQAEEALRETGQRLRVTFERAPLGIVEVNAENHFIAVNPRFCQMLGYTSEELLGMSVHDLTAPEDRERSDQMNASLHTPGREMFNYEKRYLKKDGSPLWVNVTVSGLRSQGGRLDGAIGIIEDITERKQAEEAIRMRERDLRRAQAAAHLGSWRWDLASDTVTWSEELYRIFGVDPKSFVPTNLAASQLLHPDDREMHARSVGRALEGNTVPPFESRIVRPDGEERVVLASGFDVEFDSGGKPNVLFGIVLDITERARAVKALAESEERFRAIQEASLDGFTIHKPRYDESGKIVDFIFQYENAAAARSNGTHPDEVVGRGLLELFPGLRNSRFFEAFRQATESGHPVELEEHYKGETIAQDTWFRVVVVPSRDRIAVLTQDVPDRRQVEEELRASEAMLDAFFANSPGILNLQDEEFRYLKTDSMTPTYFHLDRQSIVGKAVGDLAPDFIKQFGPMMRRVVETGEPVTDAEVFSPVPGRPGELSHWRASYFRIPLPNGRHGIGIMGVDITDMKRTEETIRRLKEEYYLLVEHQTDLVARMSRDGRRLYVNRNFLEMVGKSEEEVLTSDYAPEIHPDDAPHVAREWQRTFQAPRYRSAITCRTRTVHGWRWLSWRNTALFDELGEPTTAISVGRDVTELVEAEEDLKKANQDLERRNLELDAERLKWQRVIEGIADEIWSCDLDGKMTLMNLVAQPAMQLEEFTGRTIEQVNEEVDILNIDGTLRAAEDAPLLQALKGRVVRGEEIMVHRTTGIRRYRQYSAVPVRDAEGKIAGGVAIVRDVTQAKQAELEARRAEQAVRLLNEELEERVRQRTRALEVANKELEAFSYSVSHDLRSPLRLINGFADLLVRQGEESLSEKQKESLRTIQAQVALMDELIRALLEFSRLSRKELRRVRVDTRKLVEDVVKEQKQILGEELAQNVHVEIGDLPTAEADPILLRMVFTNLLSNAFKFTRSVKNPTVRIDAKLMEGFHTIRIQDNGVGFPKGQTERLFKVFQRLHAAGEFEGTGIGLANVRKIIEKHGGQVCGEGEEGKGAAFFFTLPARTPGTDFSEVPMSKVVG